MTRDSFVFYRSFQEAVNALPADMKLPIYEAVIDYALNGTLPSLQGVELAIFSLIKPVLDKNNQLYANGCKGAKDGKKGGRPMKEKPQNNPKKTPKGLSEETPSSSNDVDEEVDVDDDVHDDVYEDVEGHVESDTRARMTDRDDRLLQDYALKALENINNLSDNARQWIGKPLENLIKWVAGKEEIKAGNDVISSVEYMQYLEFLTGHENRIVGAYEKYAECSQTNEIKNKRQYILTLLYNEARGE